MRIAIVIGGLGNGGAERVVCNLSNHFSKKHNVTIITLSALKSSYYLEKNVTHLPLEKKVSNTNFLIKNIRRLVNIKKIIKKNEYDIFLTFLPIPSYMMLLFRRSINVPIIVSVRNDPKIEYSSYISRGIMKLLYPLADGYVFQTEEALDYFDGIISKKSAIIPNPINENFIGEVYRGERKNTIVSVGRLTEQKNHFLLIEAFSKISNKYKNYKLIIYGEGHLRGILEQKIKQLGLQDRVELPGNVSNIKEHIKDARLFILSSDYEGMPNALMEAMALGLPVISTDCPCGGARFLIRNNKNGILVPVKNSNMMSQAMDKILSDNDFAEKISNDAYKIIDLLNPNNVFDEWEKYILDIIESHKK